MRFLIIVLIVLLNNPSFGQNKQICITIDDLPVVTYEIQNPELDKEIIGKLVNTFDQYKIPAIGYVNEGKLYQHGKLDTAKVDLLNTWLKNGYDLGNHTYSHYDYNKVADSVYFKDILKGERITRSLMKAHQKELVFFRHPFLHSGHTKGRSDSLSNFLAKHHYQEAPVTIDDEDYLFAKAYHNAYNANDHKTMKKIGKMYVKYMEKILVFYEQKSKELFSREIPQTLLIHANLLNADYLDDLAKMYKEYGYTFISQAETLKDNVYLQPVTIYSAKGNSWIFRWAFSLGKGEEFAAGSPVTPEEILELSKKK